MSDFELLSILIACIAAIISLVVWLGQRKLQQEANNLQRATSELAKKQLELFVREENGKNTARLSLSLVPNGPSFRFRIANLSEVEARHVEVKLLIDRHQNPIIDSEYKEKFPVKSLPPGGSISLIAAIAGGRLAAFNAVLKWVNPDGSTTEEETYVVL